MQILELLQLFEGYSLKKDSRLTTIQSIKTENDNIGIRKRFDVWLKQNPIFNIQGKYLVGDISINTEVKFPSLMQRVFKSDTPKYKISLQYSEEEINLISKNSSWKNDGKCYTLTLFTSKYSPKEVLNINKGDTIIFNGLLTSDSLRVYSLYSSPNLLSAMMTRFSDDDTLESTEYFSLQLFER